MPIILHTLTFLICMFIQTLSTPLVRMWIFPFTAGCMILLYQGRYSTKHNTIWYATVLWIAVVASSVLMINPMISSGIEMIVLMAMPILAISLRKEYLASYIKCFGVIITIYAIGLIMQGYLGVIYTTINDTEGRWSWPLVDPNSGADVINMALIPSIWMMLFKDIRWGILSVILAGGLFMTGSLAGIGAAVVATAVMWSARYGWDTVIIIAVFTIVAMAEIYLNHPDAIMNVARRIGCRIPIWATTWQIIQINPWFGTGLGNFGAYYQHFRTETYTAGWFAHNDPMQFIAEMGVFASVFLLLPIAVLFTTCKQNLVSCLVFMATFFQSLLEFQFYTPAVSLPMGLVLGYHIINSKERKVCSGQI